MVRASPPMHPLLAAIPYQILLWSTIALLAAWWLVILLRRKAGVWRLRYFALPRGWLKMLHRRVPLYERLPWELRAPYQDKVLNFVDSKIFRACGTMDEVTEEMRLAIAGNACLLMLNTEANALFPSILTVQLYPESEEDPQARSGAIAMLWHEGLNQATDPKDRGNAELPGIAAKLGLKALPEPMLLTAWARVRHPEFHRDYPGELEKVSPGAGEEAFAVATEMFLTTPALLQQSQPSLYRAMCHFYRVDPARWSLRK